MNSFSKLIQFLGLLSFCTASTIKTAQKMSDVYEHVKPYLSKGNKTTIAFDIDYTLITYDHPALAYKNVYTHIKDFKKVMASLSPVQQDHALVYGVQQASTISLVEDSTLSTLEKIKNESFETVGLTAILLGKTGIKGDVVSWREETLSKLGVKFSRSGAPKKIFDNMPTHNNTHARYQNGIIYANGEFKGEAFAAYVDSSRETPSVAILVDDKKSNLEAFSKHLGKTHPNIKTIGIHYLGALSSQNEQISQKKFVEFWENVSATVKNSHS